MIRLEPRSMSDLLGKLLCRSVRLSTNIDIAPEPITYRGLVDDDNHLVVTIAGNEQFALQTAAAMAMIPYDVVTDGSYPPYELYEIYSEVTNVLSRAVNESVPNRLRLDPSIRHSPIDLQHIIDQGVLAAAWDLEIQGYGVSQFGVWFLDRQKPN